MSVFQESSRIFRSRKESSEISRIKKHRSSSQGERCSFWVIKHNVDYLSKARVLGERRQSLAETCRKSPRTQAAKAYRHKRQNPFHTLPQTLGGTLPQTSDPTLPQAFPEACPKGASVQRMCARRPPPTPSLREKVSPAIGEIQRGQRGKNLSFIPNPPHAIFALLMNRFNNL